MNTISVNGISYVVEAEVGAAGPHVQADWKRRGIVAMLSLRRPRGRVSRMAYRFEGGHVEIVGVLR